MRKATARIIKIGDLLGVSHQRVSKIAGERGFTLRSVVRDGIACGLGARSRHGRRSGAPRSRGNRPHNRGTFVPLGRFIEVITIQ